MLSESRYHVPRLNTGVVARHHQRMNTRPLSTSAVTTPQHHIIKECSETLSRLLQDEFKRNGYKRVHIVEKAPKTEEIDGKLPAVSVYL